MNRKIILVVIISFSLGVFAAQGFGSVKQKEIKKPLDYSFLDKVMKKVDENFIDTRKDQSKQITRDDKIFGAAEGLVAAYGDPYTSFFPPEDSEIFVNNIDGKFSGVGMEITNRNGFLTVVSPLPNSPAYKAGIKAKDIISKIDGKDALNMSSFSAVKLIRGEVGTDVILNVLRKGEPDEIKIKITREIIEIPVIKSMIKDNVFIIKVFTFSGNLPKEFYKKIINDFRKSKKDKMIIDLRGNSGGLLSGAAFISGLFLKEGDLIVREDHQAKGGDKEWRAGDGYPEPSKVTDIFRGLKLGILIDGGSASASEILAGTLSDHRKAILFGETSFGKGTVQRMIDFDNGSSLKVTIAKFILPNNEWISYKGIKPDVEIKIDTKELKEMVNKGSYSTYIDSQLDKAIKYMSKIKNQKEFDKLIDDFSKIRKKNDEESKKEKAKELLNKDN